METVDIPDCWTRLNQLEKCFRCMSLEKNVTQNNVFMFLSDETSVTLSKAGITLARQEVYATARNLV